MTKRAMSRHQLKDNPAVDSFAHFSGVKLAELREHVECWRYCVRGEQKLTQLLIVAENSLKFSL